MTTDDHKKTAAMAPGVTQPPLLPKGAGGPRTMTTANDHGLEPAVRPPAKPERDKRGNWKNDFLIFRGFRPHDGKNGPVSLIVWERGCRKCGEPFEMAQSTGCEIVVDMSRLSVNCPACRKPRTAKGANS